MKKQTISTLLAALLAGATGVAAAADGGLYGAVDIGRSKQANTCTGIGAGLTCTNTATAGRLSLGYQYSKNLAFEAAYANYGVSRLTGTGIANDLEATGVQFSAIGLLPLGENFALTGQLGVANTLLKETGTIRMGTAPSFAVLGSKSSTTPTIGLGARYAFSPSVSLRAQYDSLGRVSTPAGTKSTLSLFSVGVSFAF